MGLGLTSYDDAVAGLYARTTGGVRFGLERTLALLDALGRPHEKVPAFHVAGTNGKGSTVATLDALLRQAGWRVGRYTSPHLVDFRERIVVDGRMISREEVVDFIDRQGALVERLGATFFEVTTALAFAHFAREAVDVSVIETGLGGRLDSTNVVRPLAAGVVSVGIDHVDLLGDTIEAIAAEKAGIFKTGTPALIGAGPSSARAVLRETARDVGASPVLELSTACRVEGVKTAADGTRFTLALGGERAELHTPLVGTHQAQNTAFALLMLHAAGPRWAMPLSRANDALRGITLPGRFERRGRFLFDVAHNVDGARVLAESVGAAAPAKPVVLVLCVLRDKDWRGMLAELAPLAERALLTLAPSAPAERVWDLDEALAFAQSIGVDATAVPDLGEALERAARSAETVLVTGSFHTVGDAMARLQASPLPG